MDDLTFREKVYQGLRALAVANGTNLHSILREVVAIEKWLDDEIGQCLTTSKGPNED